MIKKPTYVTNQPSLKAFDAKGGSESKTVRSATRITGDGGMFLYESLKNPRFYDQQQRVVGDVLQGTMSQFQKTNGNGFPH